VKRVQVKPLQQHKGESDGLASAFAKEVYFKVLRKFFRTPTHNTIPNKYQFPCGKMNISRTGFSRRSL